MIYIAVDPSGSFNEGKGHTGISFMKDDDFETLGTISINAKGFSQRHLYWKAIIESVIKIAIIGKSIVIIESFVNRQNGFTLGKMSETPLLIGALVWELERLGIEYLFQTPGQVKPRFRDDLLPKYIPNLTKKYLNNKEYYYLNNKMCNDHIRDSLKHLVYYKKYGGKKK